MESNIDNLRLLMERLKSIGFWARLFSWGSVRGLFADAAVDLQKLLSGNESLKDRLAESLSAASGLSKDMQIAAESLARKAAELELTNAQLAEKDERLTRCAADISSLQATKEADHQKIHELGADLRVLAERNEALALENKTLTEKAGASTTAISTLTTRKSELELELAETRSKLGCAEVELQTVRKENTKLTSEDEARRLSVDKTTADLISHREQIQKDRQAEIDAALRAESERLARLKETWNRHQDAVKEKIKSICMTHTVEYVDKVPFRGEPDNTIKICGEFIVFDSKSPANEDLANFPVYLTAQSENAKKYAKQEDVKSVIFFVVPSNTLESLKQYVYNLGDYAVYVIATDSLEQVILSLKKIEEYEFAEALSPEDRDNICRILAKFAHLTKRRIQIDSFFARQFIEMVFKSEAELPRDFLDKIVEYEKSEKLNPPTDKRTKVISTKALSDDMVKLQGETISRGITLDHGALIENLNSVQLYEKASDASVLEIIEGEPTPGDFAEHVEPLNGN